MQENHQSQMSGRQCLWSHRLRRLSRNAGDLGALIDLMDVEKLLTIKTFSQGFSNSPNEKFLL